MTGFLERDSARLIDPVATSETLAEHFDARWADWQRRGRAQDELGQRRLWIIASVIGAGSVIWLLVTAG